MSRRSEYTQKDLVNACKKKGFIHLEGIHVNSDSLHTVCCENCGRKDTKTSKTLFSTKKGKCQFLPCASKGILTKQYINLKLKNSKSGVELKDSVVKEGTDIVSRDELLEYVLSDNERSIMTSSWKKIYRRISEGRDIFVPDSEVKEIRNKLLSKEVYTLVKIHGHILRSELPTNRQALMKLECLSCGRLNRISFESLESKEVGKACECSLHLTKFNNLKQKVQDQITFEIVAEDDLLEEFKYIAFNQGLDGRKRENKFRNIRPICKCLTCGKQGKFTNYFQIVYEELLFCGNEECLDFQRLREKSNLFDFNRSKSESIEHNIKQMIDLGYSSLYEFRFSEPYTYHRFKGGTGKKATDWRNEIYNGVNKLIPGWRVEKLIEPSYEEVKNAINLASSLGEITSISSMKNLLSNSKQELAVISIAAQKCVEVLYQAAEECGFNIKRNDYESLSLDDVYQTVKNAGVFSRREINSKFPGLLNNLSKRGLLDEFNTLIGWEKPIVYKYMSDEELFIHFKKIVMETGANNISDIEYGYSSALAREIRSRDLVNVFYDKLGWQKNVSWSDLGVEGIKEIVRQENVYSASDLHGRFSGAYKYLEKLNVLNEFFEENGLILRPSYKGKRTDSRVENLVFSILELNDIYFEAHRVIKEFKGPEGGVISADIYFPDQSFIAEIWALPRGYEVDGKFQGYSRQRAFKEEMYNKNGYNLISIEALAYYKNINEKTKGLQAFSKYVVNVLNTFGIKTKVSTDDLKLITKHLSTVYM